jgi:Ser/Thr protein kinase RdoA (MazF antagonist)
MKAYDRLTVRGQIRRLRGLAVEALHSYPLSYPSLEFIYHGENTTFKVTDTGTEIGSDPAHRYLLRVHRSGYHDDRSIRSELIWLDALHTAGIQAPQPVRTRGGDNLVTVTVPGVPQERVCSLLRWVDGRFIGRQTLSHYYRLGHLMARLHEHTSKWRPPAGFTRRRWDWEGLFGDDAGFGVPAAEVWRELPKVARDPVRRAGDAARELMLRLGTEPEAYGLIHADLHFENVLFRGGSPIPIDFDDSGYAHLLYDISVPLADALDRSDWDPVRDALYQGYSSVRPLPPGVEHLPTMMAARAASVLLWATDTARFNDAFKERLEGWARWTAGRIKAAFAVGLR